MLIVIRIIFIFVGGLVGFLVADSIGWQAKWGIITGAGSGIAVILLDIFSGKISIKDLLSILIGLILGLVVASLFAYGLSRAPSLQKNENIILIIYIICIYLGIVMALKKKEELLKILDLLVV